MKFFMIGLFIFYFSSCYQDSPRDKEPVKDDQQENTGIEVLNNGSYPAKALYLIDNSRVSAYVIMYAMKYYPQNDDSPVNGLIKALADARRRGVEIKIILDNTTASDYPDTTNFLKINLISYKIHPGTITTHSKLLIIDNSYTVVGSHNWTDSAFMFNNETSVVITSKSVAEKERNYFFELYNKY